LHGLRQYSGVYYVSGCCQFNEPARARSGMTHMATLRASPQLLWWAWSTKRARPALLNVCYVRPSSGRRAGVLEVRPPTAPFFVAFVSASAHSPGAARHATDARCDSPGRLSVAGRRVLILISLLLFNDPPSWPRPPASGKAWRRRDTLLVSLHQREQATPRAQMHRAGLGPVDTIQCL
jgi:hypothetical protein